MDLSIIIVNWNTRNLLSSCLSSVFTQSYDRPFEVWVVDNASDDGSTQMVKDQFSQVHLIESHKNIGFAAANNQAIRRSKGRYILLLNPDTRVMPGAFEALLRFMEAHPSTGAAGARLINPDGTLQTSCYPAPSLTREFWRLFHLDELRLFAHYPMTRWDVNAPREVDVVQGACLVIRREALAEVESLDEDYFMYSEEVDLCLQLRRTGWDIYWVPEARVVHYGGQSTGQVSAEMFLQLYKSKILYFRKHHGILVDQAYKLILLSASLVRLLLSPLAWLESPNNRKKHLFLAGNYFRLIKTLPRM